jgi:hypothetical protein
MIHHFPKISYNGKPQVVSRYILSNPCLERKRACVGFTKLITLHSLLIKGTAFLKFSFVVAYNGLTNCIQQGQYSQQSIFFLTKGPIRWSVCHYQAFPA